MKKLIKACMLVMIICFFLLGIVFKFTSENHRGVSASSGVIVNGTYTEIASGSLGRNSEKMESFNTGATIFFVLAGVSTCVYIVVAIRKD